MLINKVSYTDKIWFLSHTKKFTRICFHNMSPMMILYLYAKNQKILPIEYWENPQTLHFGPFLAQICSKRLSFQKLVLSIWIVCGLTSLWKKTRENKWVNVEKSSWSDFGLDIWGILAPVSLLAITFVPYDEKNWLYPSFKSW